MIRVTKFGVTLMTATLCLGCGRETLQAPLNSAGFHSAAFGVRAGAVGSQFIGPNWRVDDWVLGPKGWEPRPGGAYETSRELDVNGDGVIDASERFSERVSDLKLVHREDGSVIWIKIHPVTLQGSKVGLSSVLDQFTDGLVGAQPIAQSTFFLATRPSIRLQTPFLVERKLAAVDGRPAISGTVEIADNVRLAADPKHRKSKTRVVIAKLGHLQRHSGAKPPASPWPVSVAGPSSWLVERRAFLVIGYAAFIDDYEKHEAEFESFVSSVRLDGFVFGPEDPDEVAKSVKALKPEEPKSAPTEVSASVPTPPADPTPPPAAVPDSAPPPTTPTPKP